MSIKTKKWNCLEDDTFDATMRGALEKWSNQTLNICVKFTSSKWAIHKSDCAIVVYKCSIGSSVICPLLVLSHIHILNEIHVLQ